MSGEHRGDHGPRDRETVRRALLVAAVTWALFSALLLAGASPRDPRDVVTIVAVALTFAGMGSSAWLLLAGFLDLRAGEAPSRRRWIWTAGIMFATFTSPLLAAAVAR